MCLVFLCVTWRGGGAVVGGGAFGEGTGIILLDDVHCEGSESSLLDCRHGIWGRSTCSYSEVVGVRCRRDPSTDTNQLPALAPATGVCGRGMCVSVCV